MSVGPACPPLFPPPLSALLGVWVGLSCCHVPKYGCELRRSALLSGSGEIHCCSTVFQFVNTDRRRVRRPNGGSGSRNSRFLSITRVEYTTKLHPRFCLGLTTGPIGTSITRSRRSTSSRRCWSPGGRYFCPADLRACQTRCQPDHSTEPAPRAPGSRCRRERVVSRLDHPLPPQSPGVRLAPLSRG